MVYMYVPPCTQVVSYGRLLKKSQVHESTPEVNYDLSKLRAAEEKMWGLQQVHSRNQGKYCKGPVHLMSM